MGEPVFAGVARHALCFAIIWAGAFCWEPPDVPSPGTIAVAVNPLSVGRVVGTVVKAWAGSQPLFFSSADRNAIDVKIPAALADKRQPAPVRRPAMKVAWNICGDQLRTRAVRVGNIDLRSLSGSMFRREGQTLTIRRQSLVIVAVVSLVQSELFGLRFAVGLQ